MSESESKKTAVESTKVLRPWYARKRKKSEEESPWIVRWFYGVLKEFRRIQWMRGRDVIENIIVVVVFVLILIAVFAAVDAIFLNGKILGE